MSALRRSTKLARRWTCCSGADGTEHTFDLAGRDTAEAAKGIGKAADKTGKVTVYYTEAGGKKIAHFFEKL